MSCWRHPVDVGAPANAGTVVGVSTVAGVPAVVGLPAAVDVCDVSMVSAAANPAVANVLQ